MFKSINSIRPFLFLFLITLFFSCLEDPDVIPPTFVTITDNITTATTWTKQNDIPNSDDYKITRDININEVLTIEPGVRISFDSGVLMRVTSDGALIAKGTAAENIVFTGCEAIPGFWGGIRYRSSDVRNEMDYCQVSFGGSSNIEAMITVEDFAGIDGRLKLTNSTLSNSLTVGLDVEEEAVLSPFNNNVFSNNTGSPIRASLNNVHNIDATTDFSNGNGFNGVEIADSELELPVDVTWNKLSNGAQYLVAGDCNLNSGVTVEAGSEFIMEPSVEFKVDKDGYLIAEGTAIEKIVFDGLINDQASWKGILFRSGDFRNILDHCVINAAGSSELSNTVANIVVDDFAGVASKVTIQNCEITGGGGCGIFIDEDAELTHANNVFANNLLDDICQ